MPPEATFSRDFDAFARDGRPQRIHEATIKAHDGEKIARHVYKRHLDVIDGDIPVSAILTTGHYHVQNPLWRPPKAGDARGSASGSLVS